MHCHAKRLSATEAKLSYFHIFAVEISAAEDLKAFHYALCSLALQITKTIHESKIRPLVYYYNLLKLLVISDKILEWRSDKWRKRCKQTCREREIEYFLLSTVEIFYCVKPSV